MDYCSGRHGFIVAITGIESVGKGLIREGTGFVTFPVKYQCVVFRPFKGEILEAVVTMVNKVNIIDLLFIFLEMGYSTCFMHLLFKDFIGLLQMGFFAEAGPVQIFVSNHVSIEF